MMFRFEKKCFLLFVMLLGVSWGFVAEVAGATPADKAQTPEAKKAEATTNAPRELAMQPLAEYRINPPDVIDVEMLKMVPLQPYHITVYDVLQIRAAFALPDQPISDFFIVEGGGEVNLGPAYGSVKVVGMTIEEAEKAVSKKLNEVLTKSEVSVQLSKTSATQPVTGQYLVASDGRINLRQYGTVSISGKTIAEARQAIEKQLAKFFTSPEVNVDIHGYNSQFYYIIADGAGMGDHVKRVPITGHETVLDAIVAVEGLSAMSSRKMWISRPSATNAEKGEILPIDYTAITQRGATATNYQLQPGDRLFIEGDSTIKLNYELGLKTAPIERTLGLMSLGASTRNMVNANRENAPPSGGPEASKQSPKQESKADKIDDKLIEDLQRYLQELLPLLEKQ